MSKGWLVADQRPNDGVHVIPCDEQGVILPNHRPSWTCECRPVLVREGPLDEPIINHREPGHPGANTRFDA